MSLQVHLPNNRLVSFSEDNVMTDILEKEMDKISMFTAFFELNKTDVNTRQYLYKDIPKYYTCNKSTHKWNLRKKRANEGRLVSANPAEGERFYLRVLLQNVKGPTGFEYLYTVNSVLYSTFLRAALERGLIKSDDYISDCLRESSMHEMPDPLRRLFTTLVFCEPGDVRKLWNDHYESLSEDYILDCASVERVQNMVLTDISSIIQSMGKSPSDFDLSNITADVSLESFGCRELQEECSIVVQDVDILARQYLIGEFTNVLGTSQVTTIGLCITLDLYAFSLFPISVFCVPAVDVVDLARWYYGFRYFGCNCLVESVS